MRTCSTCGETKSPDCFYSNRGKLDSACKECRKAKVRAYRAANLEKVRAYDLARANQPERRARRAAYIDRHPMKVKARTAVSNAIRDGRLVRGPCTRCGTTKNVHGHHHDYSKPLDVTWLCKDCHWAEHAEEMKA